MEKAEENAAFLIIIYIGRAISVPFICVWHILVEILRINKESHDRRFIIGHDFFLFLFLFVWRIFM